MALDYFSKSILEENLVYLIFIDRIRLLTMKLLVSIKWPLCQLHIDVKVDDIKRSPLAGL